mgnify:FL=1
MNSKTLKKIIFILPTFIFCIAINANNNSSMIGYWLTSQSIVQVKECEQGLCAIIEYIFVENGVNQESILDENNKNKSLKERSLLGINLIDGFVYSNEAKELSGGKIYDPGRGRLFKSNLYLLDNGNLKVEGCLLRLCGHEEWKPMDVIINEEDGTRSAVLRE